MAYRVSRQQLSDSSSPEDDDDSDEYKYPDEPVITEVVEKKPAVDLSIKEILPILPPPPHLDDETALNFIVKRNTQLACARLEKIRKIRKETGSLLSKFNTQQLYVAFEMSDYSAERMIDRLTNSGSSDYLSHVRLKHEVQNRTIQRINDISENMINLNNASLTRTQETDGWTEQEVRYFIKLAERRKDRNSWKEILMYFPNQTDSKCEHLYNKLVKEGIIKNSIRRANHNHNLRVTQDNINHISSLTLIKDEKEFHVGQQMSKFDKIRMLNPIPDFIDQVTCKKIQIPALSQDGYILDYYTWLKIIQEEKCNPFTRNPITSKRSLTILTVDNINYYRSKIVNWDQSKPEGYEG